MYSSNRLIDRCRSNNSIMQRAKPALLISSARIRAPMKGRYYWPDTLDFIKYDRPGSTYLPLNYIGPCNRIELTDKGIFYREIATIPEGRREGYALY